ncbi:MAG: ABC transporter permease DevC [Planctomycetota bacterium]|nr:ABC transporter permease DevC [Planctomycetota bacterium]MDA1179041.1 ABC transporter permease DevC [Planctomycetota bacterium]
MFSLRSTPLALLNLFYDWRRLAIAVSGIGFAVVLMFMQTGFKNALFDSTVEVLKRLDGQILIVSSAQYSLVSAEGFPRQRLFQARACPEVAATYPLYIENGIWQSLGHKAYPIRVLAFRPGDRVFNLPEVNDALELLSEPGTALIDRMSKRVLGIVRKAAEITQQKAELSGRTLRLVGSFQLGTDFVNDGNVLMGAENFRKFFPARVPGGDTLSRVDMGVVHLHPHASVDLAVAHLTKILPQDVKVFERQKFIGNEILFWNRSTPIGFVFSMGTIVGFVVGMIVCYQVIHSDISDHMGEFATLKAMGYRSRYFYGLILQQSCYLSFLSFVPGCLISILLFQALSSWTGLLLVMNVQRAIAVFLLTMLMCVVSGIMALRKLLEVDPAELF